MTFLHPYQLSFLSVNKSKTGRHLGDPKSKVDSHISEPRKPYSGIPGSQVLPPVTNPEGKTLSCLVTLEEDGLVLTLHEVATPDCRKLYFHTNGPGHCYVSGVAELTKLIDALYALGAAWQKQDQTPEVPRGSQ